MAGMHDLPEVTAADRTAWRHWLDLHHDRSVGVWLVFFKKDSGVASVTYDEAVEECLCYGWIDSQVRKRDAGSYRQLMTPRKPRSVWSKLNKSRVERLVAEGRMHPAGQVKVDAARQDGSWESLDSAEALEVPPDLAEGLDAVPQARAHWNRFSPSSRRAILQWLGAAKRPETRSARVARISEMAGMNLRALIDARP